MTNELFGNVIYAYTRAQAIEDGVLIDVTETAKEAGFKLHTVITTGVHGLLMEQPEAKDNYGGLLLSILATAHHILVTPALQGIDSRNDHDRVYFQFRGQTVYLHCGPGDHAEPVLTLMLEHED